MKDDFHYKIDLLFNAFNEIESLENDLNVITSNFKNNKYVSNIVVLEDGSTDGTSEKLRELKDKLGFNLNQSESRRGYANALLEGLSSTDADFVFFSDLGGKFDWAEIELLIQHIPQYDFILGIRTNRTDQIYRRMLTKCYSLFIKIFFGVYSRDPDSGFRVYNMKTLKTIMNNDLHNKHLLNSEFTVKLLVNNASYKEVEINYFPRIGASRGLPIKIIPKVIYSTIKSSFKIKRQIKKQKF